MKKAVMAAVAAAVLVSGGAYAMDMSRMHEMMMKNGGMKKDERTELKLPAPAKVMQKKMMRDHLDALGQITAYLAANDLEKAAAVSKEKLGWNADEEEKCKAVEEVTGAKEFMALGKAVHQKADELSEAAKAGNRDKALEHLAALIKDCNACHEKYRH